MVPNDESEESAASDRLRATDPVAYWAGAALAYVLFVGACFALWVFLYYDLLDDSRFLTGWIATVVATLVVTLWLSGFWKRWIAKQELHKWRRTYKVFAWCLCFGGLWMIATCVMLAVALFVNCHFDRSTPIMYEAVADEVYAVDSKAGPLPRARIIGQDVPFHSIPIKRSVYRMLKEKKGIIRLHVKNGLLGYKWIAKVDILGYMSPVTEHAMWSNKPGQVTAEGD